MSDYLTRTAGVGDFWSSVLLFPMVMGVLAIWRFALGTVSVNQITNPTTRCDARGFCTKPVAHGGLNLGRITSSLIIAAFIVAAILFTSRKAGSHPGAEERTAAGRSRVKAGAEITTLR